MNRFALLIILFLLPVLVLGQGFPDVPDTYPFQAHIEFLQEKGIVQGYPGGLFKPDLQVNRAEFLKMLMLAVYGRETPKIKTRCFFDFLGEEQWFWAYACLAEERGIVEGYPDGTFRGEQKVNLVEALAMAVRAWDIPMPVYIRAPDHWYEPYVTVAASRGLFELLPQYYAHVLTRAEVAALLVGLKEEIKTVATSSSSQSSNMNQTCGNGVQEGTEQCDDGNKTNGDGCSEICVDVPEPIRHAALKIDQRSSGTTDATPGSKGITMLRFDAVAGRQDVRLSGLVLEADTGNLSDATKYRLLLGDKVLGIGKVGASDVTFSGLTIPMAEGTLMTFTVQADLTRSTPGNPLRLGFATGNVRYVSAVGAVDGRELTGIETDGGGCAVSVCWISVTTTEAGTITPQSNGNLFITKDGNVTRSHQLLLGSISDPLLGFKARTTGEAISLTAINIGGGASSIDHLLLFEEFNAEATELRSLHCETQAAGKFCASAESGFSVLPKDAEKKFLLFAVLKNDTNGGVSGQNIALTLSASTTDIAFEARGQTSNAALQQNDGDGSAEGEVFVGRSSPGPNVAIVGSTHDMVGAKITLIGNANPDPDSTSVPLGLRAFGQFRFEASAHDNSKNGLDDAIITDIVFTVNAQNVQVTNLSVYNKADPSLKKSCTGSALTGTFEVTCSNLDDSSVSTAVEQGGMMELALEGTVALTGTTGTHILQASLNELGDRNTTGTITWEDDVFPFEWVDSSENQVRSTQYRTP